MILHLSRGDKFDQRALLRRLADMQYTRNELDLTQGTYRVRGDVIDIFPAESEREAIRVELFDDQIDSLALFDPLTGAISRKVPRFTGCQRRAESPQKWRRKIPQPGGMAISRRFGASVFRWSAPAFQRRRNGVRGGLRFVADCLGEEIGVCA